MELELELQNHGVWVAFLSCPLEKLVSQGQSDLPKVTR